MRVRTRRIVRGIGLPAAALGALLSADTLAIAQQDVDGASAAARGVFRAETAPVIIHRLERRWRLEPDGRGIQTLAARVEIRHEAARSEWGQLYFPYLSDRETLELVRLAVVKPDGRTVALDAAALDDLPPQESGTFDAPMLSSTRVKQVTVPALDVGDVLSYEVRRVRHTPLAAGHFWDEHSFLRAAVVVEEIFEIDWAESMFLGVKAGGSGIAESQPLTAPAGRRIRRWTHSQVEVTMPDEAALIDEAMATLEGRRARPDIQMSTFRTWPDVGAWYRDLTTPAEQPSAAVRAKARELMAGRTSSADRLKAWHRFVAQDVRYVSLALGDGRYRPRSADLVLRSRYGDCKDKHALLASLAREAGFEVEAVLISSTRPLDEDLPSPGQFDHIISRVSAPDLPPTWIDATSDVTRIGFLLPPFRDKVGLQVGAAEAQLVRTARTPAQASHMRIDIRGAYRADGRLRLTVRRETGGDIEVAMRFAVARADEQARRKLAESLVGGDGLRNGPTILRVAAADPLDLSAPFWFEYEVEKRYRSPLRHAAYDFWVPTPSLELPAASDSAGWVKLGPPTVIELSAVIEFPESLRIGPPLAVALDGEVAGYSSQYSVEGAVLHMQRRLVTKQEEVRASGLDAYRALRRTIDGDYRQRFAVSAASDEAIQAIEAATNAANAGYAALEAGDVARAVALLEKAVAAEPGHRAAWNNLGRALHRQGKWAKAIDAYERQLAINAFDEYAYNNRGLAEWSLGNLESAEASFRKQIEVAPLHKEAHRNLGDLLMALERPADARTAYEKAVALTPADGWVHIRLARALLGTGAADDALPHLERAVELSPTPQIWNEVAWRMTAHDLNPERALEFARSAVAAMTKTVNAATLTGDRRTQLRDLRSLAAYWDTLGWIQFKRGEAAAALPYIRAAFQLNPVAEIGDHLGIVYEHLGRRQDALDAYRTVLTLRKPGTTAAARLKALTGSGFVLERERTAGQAAMMKNRVVPLEPIVNGHLALKVMLLFNGDVIQEARLQEQFPEESTVRSRIVGLRVPFTSPDEALRTWVATGVVACTAETGCNLVLFGPDGEDSD